MKKDLHKDPLVIACGLTALALIFLPFGLRENRTGVEYLGEEYLGWRFSLGASETFAFGNARWYIVFWEVLLIWGGFFLYKRSQPFSVKTWALSFLKRIADLVGALTDSEFFEAKRRLLGKKQLEDPSQKSAVSLEVPPSIEWESENPDSWEAEEDAQVALKRPWGLVAYASINMAFAFLATGSLLLNFGSFSNIPYGYSQLFCGLIGACTLAGSSFAFLKGRGGGCALLFIAAGFYVIGQVISHYQADEITRQVAGVPARYGATGFLRDLPALIWLLFPLAKSRWMLSLSDSEDRKPTDSEDRKPTDSEDRKPMDWLFKTKMPAGCAWLVFLWALLAVLAVLLANDLIG